MTFDEWWRRYILTNIWDGECETYEWIRAAAQDAWTAAKSDSSPDDESKSEIDEVDFSGEASFNLENRTLTIIIHQEYPLSE